MNNRSKNVPALMLSAAVASVLTFCIISFMRSGDNNASESDLSALSARVEDLEEQVRPTPTAATHEPFFYCPEDGNPNTDNDRNNDPGGDAFPSYRECYEDAPVLAINLVVNDEYCVVANISGPLYDFVVIDSRLSSPRDMADDFTPDWEADLGSTPSGNFTIEGPCNDG